MFSDRLNKKLLTLPCLIVAFSFQGQARANLPNDTCETAEVLSAFPAIITVDTSLAATAPTTPYCGQTMQHDVWYKFTTTMPSHFRIEIDAVEPSSHTVSAVVHTPGADCSQNLLAHCEVADATGTPLVWEWALPTPRTYLLQVGVAGAGPGGPTQIKVFLPKCGDGIVEYPEPCDPAMTSPHQFACSSTCFLNGADNTRCAFAQDLGTQLPASAVSGLFGPLEELACDVDIPGYLGWFQVTGTGNTMTASTCNLLNDADTGLDVFCGLCTALQCIGGNDDQAGPYDPACHPELGGTNVGSTFSWCSSPDTSYYVAVGRVDVVFGATTEISVVDSGIPCNDALACQPPLCGNGVLNAGEECDDANLMGGDGCGAVCDEEIANDHCEGATLFTSLPFVISMDTTFADTTPRRPPLCGPNAGPQKHDVWFQFIPSESYDDVVITVDDGPNSIRASLFSGADCSNLNHITCNAASIVRDVTAGASYWIAVHDTWMNAAPGVFTLSVSQAACGNGVIELQEECDDGNMVDDDDCSNECLLPHCGDGVVQGAEVCDDGNTNWGDSCGGDCSVQAQCMQVSHCRHVPANNACNLADCTGGACAFAPCVEFGDINGSGLVNLDDILTALRGFAGEPYANANSDISPCGGNGIVNIDDLLSELAAFGGYDPCGCNPQESAPLCGSNQP